MKKNKKVTTDDEPMSVVAHLDELRHRLLICLTLIITATGVSFYFSENILRFLSNPFFKYTGLKIIHVFGITESFTIRLKSSFILALLTTIPIIILQVWLYIKPAVERPVRKYFRINLFLAIVLFYTGAAFTFLILLPFSIEMLIKFTPDFVQNTQNFSDYLNLIFYMIFMIGIIFELPVAVNLLTATGIISPSFLIKKRKYAIVAIWVISAIITPADIITQIIVAVPLMFLYEIAILFSRLTYRRKNQK